MFDGNVSGKCTIDGEETSFSANNSKVTFASGLEDTDHTAIIKVTRPDSKSGLKYVETSKGGNFTKSEKDKKYVQFIGDSISEASSSYTFTIPKEYNLDYSVIAYSGIALQDGAGWYFGSTGTVWRPTSDDTSKLKREDCVGMESAYFSVKRPKEAYYLDENGDLHYDNPAFDVSSDNAPDAIVIGIGTNDSAYIRDNVSGINGGNFTKTYIEFVTKLSNAYPNAQIYIIRPFNNVAEYSPLYDDLREAVVNAVNGLNSNANVHYIDTTAWNVEISSDKVHPSEKGYADLRDLVYNEIKSSLN